MKKIFILFMLLLSMQSNVFAQTDETEEDIEQVDVSCQGIDEPEANQGIHRAPPYVPNIYLDRAHFILYFENPCYSSTLSFVSSSTGTTVYTYVIPDGADTVVLPEWLVGTYEIHIHRGNYCFYGQIVL